MSDARPNIIFIITDQQRFDTIAALGADHMETPHLDRLVNEGVTFTQCHVTAPSCAPSRASLFTGQYPHTTGILKNADEWTRSWVEDLSASGYHSVNIGKMHTWPFTTPCGFHQRYVVENKDRYLEGRYFFDEWDKALAARGLVKQQRELYRQRPDYQEAIGSFTWDLPPDMQSDHFVGGLAKWWTDTYPKTEPLFLQVGFPGPHPPYDPTPEALDSYRDKVIPLDPLTPEDLENQPKAYQGMRVHNHEVDHDSVVLPLDPTEEQRLNQRRHYCANVSMIDEEVGRIMESLEAQGYLEDSIIVFTSDHGDCLTDHGHSQKWTMYEQVTRVPLIFWAADGRFGAGRRVEDLVSLFDVGPTLMELAGVEVPDHFSARSLLPALDGDTSWKGRGYVFAEHPRDGNFTTADYQVMVRSEDWKLVEIYGSDEVEGGREGMLFDFRSDPREENNLWNDPEYESVRQELREALLAWRIETGDQASKSFAERR
ncbi:MAG: sulfatase-like hydrolase/transferase [Verrucomicrobiales bacterium]|nr:sulfatase-like hydrolase/transferase [Verrucomicrobiales bacterium]